MKRLTTREEHPHGAEGRSKDKLTGKYCRGVFEATAVVEKLSYYENMEEDGRMVILPCKPGDTVYLIRKRLSICKYGKRWGLNCEYGCPYDNYSEKCDSDYEYFLEKQIINDELDAIIARRNIGKTVFLTEQEAKEALEETKE